jgi:hypothetical protein
MTNNSNTHLKISTASVTITDEQRDAILGGLADLKQRGKRMNAKRGRERVRVQLYMSGAEFRALTALRATASLHVGRIVSLPLVARLALVGLAGRCQRSLTDPVEGAKLRADLLAARAEHAKE